MAVDEDHQKEEGRADAPLDLKALAAAIKAWAKAQRSEEFKAKARARRAGRVCDE